MENYIIAGICIIGMMVCVAYIGKQLYANYLETRNRRIEEINKKLKVEALRNENADISGRNRRSAKNYSENRKYARFIFYDKNS